MKSSKLNRALSSALESIALEPRRLIKLSQDDYDDGVQTLVLIYSDGTKETVKRIWPDLVHRGEHSGDSLHERFLEMHSAIKDPEDLWSLIQHLTEPCSSDAALGVPAIESTHLPVFDYDSNEIYGDMFKDLFAVPSTEGFISDKFAAAKESLAQWTVGIRKWKAGGWDKLSDADKLRGIKRANLEFFYHNPKYVKNLERVMKLTKELSELVLKDTSTEILQKNVDVLIKELTTLVKAVGVSDPADTLKGLQSQFKQGLKAYKAPKDHEGSLDVANQIVGLLDRYKISTSTLDALKSMAKTIGLESDAKEDALYLQTVIIGFILIFSGLWPLWIVWMIAIRPFYEGEAVGGPQYE